DDNAKFLINESFFYSKDIDSSLVNSYYEKNSDYYQRAVMGESAFLNAYKHFSMHLLALFFPLSRGQTSDGRESEGRAVFILFSPEYLNDNLSSGMNQSYLINNNGDVLIHPDFEMVRTAANISNREDVRMIRESAIRSRQDLHDIDGVKYFIAFTKLNIGASIVITSIEYKKIFEMINTTTRRNLLLTAAVVFLSILFIWFFSKTISSALKILSNAARKIEGGDFELDLKPRSRDEIGFLTTNFQR
ncbi:HAMP domain-containing protein, partial [Treponema sp. R8-4-B8]